jgi:hypothetical protein
VTFQGSTGSLTLDAPSSFTGLISGFTGNGTLAGSDQIDLKGINYNSSSFSEIYNPATGTLTVSDGTNDAMLHFSGSYQAANFSFASDGSDGTAVYDPPVPSSAAGSSGDMETARRAPSANLGGDAVNDHFVFRPGVGHSPVPNLDPDTDWGDRARFASGPEAVSPGQTANAGSALSGPEGTPGSMAFLHNPHLTAHDFHVV